MQIPTYSLDERDRRWAMARELMQAEGLVEEAKPHPRPPTMPSTRRAVGDAWVGRLHRRLRAVRPGLELTPRKEDLSCTAS